MVIYGSARPPYGPVDILVEDGFDRLHRHPPADRAPRGADAVIDATGKYVMPGIVNTHMHWHEERQPGMPQPIQYERNLYLAAGVTTAREVGGDFDKSKRWQAESNAHTIVSPRILVYPVVSKGRTGTPAEIRAWIRDIKQRGADGLKIIAMDRDQLEAIIDEAHTLGLRTDHPHRRRRDDGEGLHRARRELDRALLRRRRRRARRRAELPARHELLRRDPPLRPRRRAVGAGRSARSCSQVIDMMVEKHVGWSPTFSIYEASRDVLRAQNLPWFKDYLHPSMEAFFRPSLDNHGSYFLGWTTTQEARWKQQYRIWMDAVREFGAQGRPDHDRRRRRLHLLDVRLRHRARAGAARGGRLPSARGHRARDLERRPVLGMDDRLGKVREGFIADLLVVNGNPLENLKLLNPYGTDVMLLNGRPVSNYTPLGAGRPGAGRARRRHRVDDQGRHPVPRADADARGAATWSRGRAQRVNARRHP